MFSRRFAAAVSFLLLYACPLHGSRITVTYTFDRPVVERTRAEYSRMIFPGTIQAGATGSPSFPFRRAVILLPPGESVRDVKIERRGWKTIDGKVILHPRQNPVPVSGEEPADRKLLVDRAAYSSAGWIHPPVSRFKTRYLCGHSIATGSFSPAAFNPSAGEAGFFGEIEITVETVFDGNSMSALSLLRTDETANSRIEGLIDNREDIPGYAARTDNSISPAGKIPLSPAQADRYEYLLITRDSFKEDFEPLSEFYTRRGVRTKILTVEEIESEFGGTDTPEKIRNAIIFEYVENGISFVLLGGDGDGTPGDEMIVPYRGLFGRVESSSIYEDESIPADLYYAALDGSWNGDGDQYWGEPGEEDLFSEVSVGRACVDSPEEIEAFIKKTIGYQESPVVCDVRSALLLGERLYTDPLTYGGDEMDQLIGVCTDHGFSTTGLPPGFALTKLYDRDLGAWPKTDVMDAVNAGVNWIVHAGHANIGTSMRLTRPDITDVNFCYSASFDFDDCIAEDILAIDHFACAFIGNSRFGWFTEGTTNGPSHHFQREFYDAVFTEGITEIGRANQRSKDETVPFVDLPEEYEPGALRWCFYCLNLLGDPALDGWTDTPSMMEVGHSPTIGRLDTVFAVETDAAGTAACLFWEGVCYARTLSLEDGRIVLALDGPLPDGIDSLELNLTAHGYYGYRDTIQVVETSGNDTPAASTVLYQNAPNPFNPYTEIRFSLENEGRADLRVYDVSGREVAVLVNRSLPAGPHSIKWSPSNLSSGVYFYVLRAGSSTIGRKAVLLR